ncbi:hypothetical protein [Dictyobacter kobayashii]|nr:hypothetical protein [Dictyobacter kobayashii]
MVTPAVDGIDLFKIAGRSISGWIPSFKMGALSPIRQPFCSQLEERLLMWLEYNPQVVSYARGVKAGVITSRLRIGRPSETNSKEQHSMSAGEQMPTKLRQNQVIPTPAHKRRLPNAGRFAAGGAESHFR